MLSHTEDGIIFLALGEGGKLSQSLVKCSYQTLCADWPRLTKRSPVTYDAANGNLEFLYGIVVGKPGADVNFI